MRGLFVTGTDTGVGKSVVCASVLSALSERGLRVAAFKPAVTGLGESPGHFGHDHVLLAASANVDQTPEDVAPYRFEPPLSPHLAAELAGEIIDPARLQKTAHAAAKAADLLVCEGVGGLMVPLCAGYRIVDLVGDLGLNCVIAARTGLGTINHTVLTVSCAQAAGVSVAGIVLTPWPHAPCAIEVSNKRTIEDLCGVGVATLRHTTQGDLASAGAELPLDDWL